MAFWGRVRKSNGLYRICHRHAEIGPVRSSFGDEAGGGMCVLRTWGLWAAAILFACILAGNPAQAQTALCPASFPGQPGILFQGSSCTNNVTGAYSNAALASQSLGELSETSTQDATRTTMASVAERRTTEQQSCPAGTTRVAGECVPSAASRFAADAPDAIALLALAQSLTMVPARPLAPDQPHWAVWAQGYGDYEQRSGQSPGPSAAGFSALALSANSTMWTGGMMGGAD